MIGCPRCHYRIDQPAQWVEDTPVGVVVVDTEADTPYAQRECIGCGWGFLVTDRHQRIELELIPAIREERRLRRRLNWEARWAH